MPSTVIRRFAYDASSRTLVVTFVTGRRYRYRAVPAAAVEAFRAAFSKGQHFNAEIRDRYPFEEIAADDGP